MVLSILQLTVSFKQISIFSRILSSLILLCVSKHLLLHCANVTFLLVQSHAFFFVGVTSPSLLAAPHAQGLSKVLLFALPPRSTPHGSVPSAPELGRKLAHRHSGQVHRTSCRLLTSTNRQNLWHMLCHEQPRWDTCGWVRRQQGGHPPTQSHTQASCGLLER